MQAAHAWFQSGGDWWYAMSYCSNLNIGGFTGWFLPSISELQLMRQNIYLRGLGGFIGWYWSSTEFNDDVAWEFNFSSGGATEYWKDYGNRARPIRRF